VRGKKANGTGCGRGRKNAAPGRERRISRHGQSPWFRGAGPRVNGIPSASHKSSRILLCEKRPACATSPWSGQRPMPAARPQPVRKPQGSKPGGATWTP